MPPSLAMAIDAKDQSTHGHVQEVKAMALKMAEIHGIEDEDLVRGLRAAALLHDIGKLAVPEYILNKPGKLTESEMAKIRIHPTVGGDILETIPFPYDVAPYVRHHHERWGWIIRCRRFDSADSRHFLSKRIDSADGGRSRNQLHCQRRQRRQQYRRQYHYRFTKSRGGRVVDQRD